LYSFQNEIGNSANYDVNSLTDSPFNDITAYVEVFQETMLIMFDSGKINFLLTTS
jgi:acyl-CoA hydrolase